MEIKKVHLWKVLFAVSIIALAIWLTTTIDNYDFLQKIATKYGYLGTFFVSIVGGFNLIVPVPAITFLPVLVVVGLNKWLLILIISLGTTIADSVAFLIGKYSRKFVKEKTISRMEKLKKLHEKHHWMPLAFLLVFASFAPLSNELLVIPLSFLGFRLKIILPIVFLGNLIFNSIVGLGLITISGII